ncbi:VlmB-like protein (plasmid) [Streptomyces sp. NBC_01387]|uniref:VlmB-like protein n=1 Tax=unclassified Streptomyces TaxID=2593676 RepID=UPI002024AC9D|nr:MULTISPECIES: VlmB-like protein [unclassified Streptomyces]MCX4554416.1 VlmB-like protein [Streptomyces sp. NBC_01500]WSC25204.1 VlmB-like protein [Streptomyces sp. NBC_01766]WSV58920.1 VlmB-like protein [Streptomyces sp. NBC_01014]
MTESPQSAVAQEADWETAPGLLDGAKELTLGPEECNLAYWITQVAQGTLRDRGVTGHHESALVPDFLKAPGPLREALVLEFGFRGLSEEVATRLLAPYVEIAPGIPEMEFYATQLLDEARHARVFRNHLVELGMPEATLLRDIEDMAADYQREVLQPVIDFTLDVVQKQRDFPGAVAVFAIVIEGVLAPAAELSERKWTPLSPATGEISRGTAIDEIRHLTVASTILRDHVRKHPEYRPRLVEILQAGVALWDDIDDRKFVIHREELFQKGMEEHADRIGDYEIWPGTRLLDTTPEQRYDMAEQWTDEMAAARMAYMGLPVEWLGSPAQGDA